MVDDIQAIYRVADPLAMPSPRFFAHAQRLPIRGGAVAHVLARELQPEQTTGVVEQAGAYSPPASEGTTDDVASIAAMSQHPGFPSIGYAS